jgi:O-antigen ligase
MEFFFLTLLFLIPFIGLYSGLSVAVTVPIFSLSCLFYIIPKSILNKTYEFKMENDIRELLHFRIKDYKHEVALIIWILLSAFWSINFINSFFSAIKFITEFLLGLLLIRNIVKIDIARSKIENILIISLLSSIVIFFIEYLTYGKVSLFFRELTQNKESHVFFLHNLDRGMALLTLLSWVVIAIFLKRKNKIAALLVYFTLLPVLSFSDNLAALVAHLISAIVFLATRLTMLKNPKILCFLFLICSALMIIFAFKVDAFEIGQKNKILPLSAKHRLFIWNFVAENSKDHPILGIGFNSSKQFPVEEEQIIGLFGEKLHPLPLHPHNNIMQIYFELGVIGLVLYLSLICKYILIIGKNYKTTNFTNKNLICSLYACFSVYFIISMISYSYWQSWWISSTLWITALCAMLIIPEIDS